jgi:hypothetical protein
VADIRKELAEATRLYEETARAHEAARQAVIAAALTALRGGVTPNEVEELSPFTSAYVRRIARDAGIPPAPPGPKRKARADAGSREA